MKNLNRKISAVALSSMVMFGGVAVSGISSFAASSKGVSVEQQKDGVRERLEAHCRKYDYRVKEEFSSKEEAKQAIKAIKDQGFFKVYGGIRKLNKGNIDKLLKQLWRYNYERVVVEFEGKLFLIGLDYRMIGE